MIVSFPQHFQAEKSPARGVSVRAGPRAYCCETLVVQLEAELKRPRVKGIGDRAEVAGTEVRADAASLAVAAELGVIPGVEALRTELQSRAARFTKHEAFE